MKRLLLGLALLTLVGAGCAAPAVKPADTTTYANAQYGFAFEYPAKTMDVHVREDAIRKAKYLGLDADFFASVRDTVQDPKNLTTLAYLYAVPGLTVDAFKAALVKSATGITVKETTPHTVNGIQMTKIVSTTASGEDKTHELFTLNGQTIIIDEFLFQEKEFDAVLSTFRPSGR
jgi:hypothetical protein